MKHFACIRTFEIVQADGNEFYGAVVGERFTTSTVDENGDLWLRPSENPCIREEFWKDMGRLCILCGDEEIELNTVKEI